MTLENGAEAWAYDFFPLFSLDFLKYLEMVLISLGDFTGIRGERLEIEAGLAATLPFLEVLAPFNSRLNCIFTLCLKEKLLLFMISSPHSTSKMEEMKLQAALLTPLRSAMLLALPCLIFLLRMYFPI